VIVNGRRCWISLSIILATAGACRQASRTDSGPVTAGPADGKVEQRRSGLTALSRTGWVASASPTGTPANAIDGSATTRWTTTSIQANGNFFQVDLGAQRTFTEIRMDTTTTATDFPRSFNVGVSNDGSTFTTVASAMGTSAVVTVAFASQTARYIRVTLANLPAGQTNAWSIYEFNVYDASLARTGWTATALTTAPGTTTGGALDGSTTTRWSSTSGTSHQFQVDMLALQTFNQPKILTGGGPGFSTNVLMLGIYNNGFPTLGKIPQLGYASAQVWVLFIIIIAVIALTAKFSSLWTYSDNTPD